MHIFSHNAARKKASVTQFPEETNLIFNHNSNDANSWFERGKNFYNKGKYDQAIENFDQAINLDRNNADYLFNRGLAWYWKENYDKAINDFNKAIELDKNNGFYPHYRGRTRYYQGLYEEAIKDFDKATELNTNNAIFYLYRGRALVSTGIYDKAFEDLNEAIKRNGKSAYFHLGIANYYKGNYEEALENLERDLSNYLSDPTIWAIKGYMLLAQQRFEESRDCFNKAHKLNKDNLYAIQGLGLFALYAKDTKRANDYLLQVTQKQTNLSISEQQELLYYKGKSLLTMGVEQSARDCFNQADQLSSGYIPARIELANLGSKVIQPSPMVIGPSPIEEREVSIYGAAMLIQKRAYDWLYNLAKGSLQSHIKTAVTDNLKVMRQKMASGSIPSSIDFDLNVIKNVLIKILKGTEPQQKELQQKFMQDAKDLFAQYATQLWLLSENFTPTAKEQLRDFYTKLTKIITLFQDLIDREFAKENLEKIVDSIKVIEHYEFDLDIKLIKAETDKIKNLAFEQLQRIAEKWKADKPLTFTEAEALIQPFHKELETFMVITAKTKSEGDNKSEALTVLWYVGMSALTLASSAVGIAVAVVAANPLSIALACINTCKMIGDIIHARPLGEKDNKDMKKVQDLIQQLGTYIGACFVEMQKQNENLQKMLKQSHQQIMEAIKEVQQGLTVLQTSLNMANSKLNDISNKINELFMHNFLKLKANVIDNRLRFPLKPKKVSKKESERVSQFYSLFYDWASERNPLYEIMWPIAIRQLLLFISIKPEFTPNDFVKRELDHLINLGKELSKNQPHITIQLEELRIFKAVYFPNDLLTNSLQEAMQTSGEIVNQMNEQPEALVYSVPVKLSTSSFSHFSQSDNVMNSSNHKDKHEQVQNQDQPIPKAWC